MARRVLSLGIVAALGCATGGATLGPGAAAERVRPVAGCYVGAAYLFVDSTADADVRRDFPQWLVLEAPKRAAGARPEGVGRLVVGGAQPESRVAWAVIGDSVAVSEQAFPAARWMLVRTADGLAGRAIFHGDVLTRDAAGRPVAQRTTWPAVLRRVGCDAVPVSARRDA